MRAAIRGIFGYDERARNSDPLTLDKKPDYGLPVLGHLDEVVGRVAIPVVTARRALGIPIRAIVQARRTNMSQCGHGSERDEDREVFDLHHRRPVEHPAGAACLVIVSWG